ncbi:MAG: CopD family protein [Cyclobacteriaceae bacterium]|jgi:putative membrane protein|nr:CopD family protein [Flammeovirgaceae bacterium]MCZ8023069.1 CopD family protein [Cytophagales bacterium]MCZ8326711.1 CopD family protein [Cyclobacteriaceae bacterium]
MAHLYLKAVHIIFIVTWFAGLFYMPRLLIYIREAFDKTEEEKKYTLPQLTLMAKRLWWGITWPSAIITLGLGVAMLVNQPHWLSLPFMHLKLTLVFFLYLYHYSLQIIFQQLQKGLTKYSSNQLRFWNEVATLFLIAIVFLIVLKDSLSMVWGLAGLFVVTFLILAGMKIYKKYRNNA